MKTTAETQARVSDLLAGKIAVPLPTYFALGRHPLPSEVVSKLESFNGELCENLYYLGKRTTILTSERIKIVALGGPLDPSLPPGTSKSNYTPHCTPDDASALKTAESADILLTHAWPNNIRGNSKVPFPTSSGDTPQPQEHQSIAHLVSTLRPRYHFTPSPSSFYEREPFFHPHRSDPEAGYSITRFLSLAPFNNPSKQKWIYAFSLDPIASPPLTVPPGTTASPLSPPPKKRPSPHDDDAAAGFSRFAVDRSDSHRPRKRPKGPPPGPEECFFCLANPALAAHLVVSIGSDAYLTTSKGPLTTRATFPDLGGFPGHMLIIPLAHAATLGAIPEAGARRTALGEMRRYGGALRRMLVEKGRGRLGSVTWEVRRAGGVHAHWQFLPVEAGMVRKGLVEAAFRVEAENAGYPSFEAVDRRDGEGDDDDLEGGDCFRVWVWEPPGGEGELNGEDGSSVTGREKVISLPLDASFRFDLQMGRRVLGKLLGLERRTHWRDCDQSEQEETAEAEAFKEVFKSHDFTLED